MVRYVWAFIFFSYATYISSAEFRIPVENPQLFNTDAEILRVIVQLSESMTGTSRSTMESTAPDLFALPEALVNSYGFGNSEFIVDLDQEGLKIRLLSAGIQLWEGDRPEFLVWATEERGLERLMIGTEPHPVVDQLLANGTRFGLSLRRPLMDLDDTLALSAAEIWGEFEGAVEQASKRYGASQIIVIGDRPEHSHLRYWLIHANEKILTGEVSGESPEERVEGFTIKLVQYARNMNLSNNLTTAPETKNSVLLEDQIETNGTIFRVKYDDMLAMMDLVDYLDVNKSISVREISILNGIVELRITTELTLEQTNKIMAGFKSMQLVEPQFYSLN